MDTRKFKNLTASALVASGYGTLSGVIINSHTSGTLKLWDSLTASGTVIANTITFAAGERWVPFFDATFDTGLFATISGTADITLVYDI